MIAVSFELNNTCEGAAMTNETLVQCLSRLESELHLPEVRRDKHRLNALLHADFEEVGRSGRYWSRDATVDTLLREADADAVEVVADRYHAVELAPNVALLTYRAAHRQADGTLARHTLRSSLWLSAGGQWQMRYHQGTPAAEAW
ncbi:nuclear transport factor 2 family protein [Massilia violaceinigra]|uniref:Nuclear transport factor 2 family protein n=2 Tax=Massilia violaceinigra TaxID=2045208 RepID=A0ABY4AER4_9BURK|nr:nuclear transport factor 2 family protein [Massilia violaceinigra]